MYNSFTCLIKFISSIFIPLDAIVNGIVYMVIYCLCVENAAELDVLCVVPATVLNLFFNSGWFFSCIL